MKKKLKKQLMCAGLILGLGALTACGNNQTETMKQEEPIAETESSSAQETQVSESTSETPATEEETQEEMTTVYLDAKGSVYSVWGDEVEEYTYECEYDANGQKIKSVRYNTDGLSFVDEECEYDADGRLLKKVLSDADGITEQYGCEYDENGNQTKEITYDADGSGYVSGEYEYDANGNRIKYVIYHEDGSQSAVYEWDANGNNVKYTNCERGDGYGALSSESEYDAYDNMLKQITYDENGDLHGIEEHEYNDSGVEIRKTTVYYKNGQIATTYITSYEYDDQGNQILVYETWDGKPWDRREKEYDDKGNLVKVTRYNMDDDISSVWEAQYNENRVKIKETLTYYSDGAVDSTSEREYDANGNQIKSVSYEADGTITSLYETEYIEMQIPKKFAPQEYWDFSLLSWS